MRISDKLRPALGLLNRTWLSSLLGLLLAFSFCCPSVRAQTVAGQERPSLDGCASFLTSGRSWHSDMTFSRVGGTPQDLDIVISDGTSDDTFPLQRAVHSYEDCLRSALDIPKPSDERPGRASLGIGITIKSGRDLAKAASSSATTKHGAQLQKPRPHVADCREHLSAFETWNVTADFTFTPADPPKVKNWAISSDVPASKSGRQSLKRFAQCIGDSLQVPQKPVFK